MKTNLLLLLFVFTASISQSQIINVPGDQSTIQNGIDAALDGDTVLVAPGEYFENILISKSILLTSQYALSEDTSDINSTIINGSQNQSSVVKVESDRNINPTIQGFTITGGSGTYLDDWVWTGGGILIFTNGEIKNNRIINNTLNSPTKSALGAGVMCVLEDETVIIKDNYIKNNTSNSNHHSMGSGIGCWGRTTNSKVKIINNVIQNNVSNVNNIYHDIIGGGGIGIVQTHIKNQNCLAVIIKNKIVNNSAPIGGGIILYSEFGARMKLLNNTIVNNESSIKGGGLVLSNARADIINSIFWNNIAPRESDISVRGELDINYSITQTEFTGVGNMIENPMLDLAYDLSSNSSAIDAGYPEFNFNDIEDEQNIGTPLWPAQGNLRNDIGCTGGNYLMDLPDSTYNLPERFLYGSQGDMVYRYSYPKNYDSNNKYPLTIVLHGSDDQGDDNEIQMDIGLRWRTNADYYGHNEFTIVPQLLYWTPEDILNLIKYIREIGSIDTTKITLTGWSMGGYALCDIIAEYPKVFCSGIPIAGPRYSPKIRHTPFWLFHGTDDGLVDVSQGYKFIEKFEDTGLYPIKTEEISEQQLIEAIDGNKRLFFTEFQDGTHNITRYVWDNEYLFRWLKNLKKPLIYPENEMTDQVYYNAHNDSITFQVMFSNSENHNMDLTGYIDNKKGSIYSEFNLFDDGQHGDLLANDGVWGNIIEPFNNESEFRVGVKIIDLDLGNEHNFHDLSRITTQGPIILEKFTVTSDDTIWNSGDRLRFSLKLKNLGKTDTVYIVDVNIYGDDSTIVNSTTGTPIFGDIAPGESLTNSSRDFALTLRKGDDSTSPGPHDILFEITSNGKVFWTDTYTIMVEYPTYIKDEAQLSNYFSLNQNYPNPFNPSTTIKYSIPKQSNVTLKVFDVLGSEVATLVNKEQSQGNYEVEFGRNDLTSGIYFYKLQAGDFVETKKMILLK